MQKEIWKSVKGYEGIYCISSYGRMFTMSRYKYIFKTTRFYNKGRLIFPANGNSGYLIVGLTKNLKYKTYLVHRLVCEAHVDNPNNYKYVNHKNGIKHDNRAENLEWCTARQNTEHAFKNGLINTGNHKIKLNSKEVEKIRKSKISCIELAKIYDVHQSTIYAVKNYLTWKNIK